MQKPDAPDTLLRMRSAPWGMRVRRRRASFISAPVVFTRSCRMASARGSVSIAPYHNRRIPSFRRQHADRCCRPIRQCRNCLVSRTVAAAAARRARHAWVSATRRFLAAAPQATSLLRLAPGRFQIFRVPIEKPGSAARKSADTVSTSTVAFRAEAAIRGNIDCHAAPSSAGDPPKQHHRLEAGSMLDVDLRARPPASSYRTELRE